MKKFCDTYNVSRETFLTLKEYQSMLFDWQQKFNLVSSSSLKDSWNRHFLDSVQLFKFVPLDAKTLYDFGSGAGFPGMVLAVIAKELMPNLKVSLIESINKKTLYLNAVKDKLGVDVDIFNCRIESVPNNYVDVITSRAMTSLTELLKYSFRFCSKKTVCIFPKGKKYKEELVEAHKHWKFNCDIVSSTQSEEGKILIITNLSKRKGEK